MLFWLGAGLERYPFAYYKWFDEFLGLGAVRQQIYLRHRKASSPVTNAMGSLTFLGTPFLVRCNEYHSTVGSSTALYCTVLPCLARNPFPGMFQAVAFKGHSCTIMDCTCLTSHGVMPDAVCFVCISIISSSTTLPVLCVVHTLRYAGSRPWASSHSLFRLSSRASLRPFSYGSTQASSS